MKNKNVLSKYKGLTFAEAAEKINKKYSNRDIDTVAANSYETEMKELAKANELLKIKEQVANYKNQVPNQDGNIQGALSLNLNDPIIQNANSNWADNLTSRLYDNNQIQSLPQKPMQLVQSLQTQNSLQTSPINTQSKTIGDKIKNTANQIGDWYKNDPYAPAFTGAAVSGLTNALILSQGYDRVPPRYNTESADVKSIMQGRNINMNAIRNDLLSNQNAALNSAQNIRSNSVRTAVEQGTFNNLNDAISKLGLQEQQLGNQYKGELANTLNNLGAQNAQANLMSDDLTARNKGQYLSNVSAFAANIGENSKFLTKQKLQDQMNKFMVDVLNKQNPNVKLSEDFYQKFKSGKLSDSDWVKLNLGSEELKAMKDLYQMTQKAKTDSE